MKALWKFAKCLDEMRKLDPEIQAQTVSCFVVVAMNPGITMKDIGERVGISQASTSRNIAALSKVHRLNRPGHDLVVATEDPVERRRKVVHLTDKGKRVAESLRMIMEPETTDA
jgi:DNA-binding MarR family transcriptional regulator